ncbi:phage tail protein [Photobacterium makurazakiensis]|uniref:phage tail protein n=1 Tax=Photobacterium makurazakiensis TaxID=2910234 RepID=UPI003D0A6AD5
MTEAIYSKTKLEHLTDYIVNHLNTDVLNNKIDAWQENAQLILNGEDRGNGGYVICHWRYRVVLHIEEFPHQILDPRYLLALIACWLGDFDTERDEYDMGDPEIAVDVISHEAADVSVELELMEPVEMIPDPMGMISWKGQTYRVQAVQIDTAEEAELINEAAD